MSQSNQVRWFSDGGCAIHRLGWKQGDYWRTSVWLDKEGELLDLEVLDSTDRTKHVPKNGPMWRDIAGMAKKAFELARLVRE